MLKQDYAISVTVFHHLFYKSTSIIAQLSRSTNAPISILPHYPPSGLSGALLGALTQNYCPTMGHLIKA